MGGKTPQCDCKVLQGVKIGGEVFIPAIYLQFFSDAFSVVLDRLLRDAKCFRYFFC